jgi:hypothetical protein
LRPQAKRLFIVCQQNQLWFSKFARVLVRRDHIASFIINANHGIMRADEKLTAFVELE